jgi:hypothetical protein
MRATSPGRLLIAGLVSCGAIACALAATAPKPVRAQDPAAKAGGGQDQKLAPSIVGAVECERCHTQPTPPDQKLIDQGEILCRLVEWKEFTERDRHKDALKVLQDPRATKIGALLGIKDVTQDASCLSCHGLVIPADVKPERTFEALKDGVTCVACHGTTGQWVLVHARPDVKFPGAAKAWKELTREEKARDFGMTDLWDPAIRAANCASCHIGNASQGKVVTHAMYAAGHPPLPGLEVASFSDEEPRHWQYLGEKKPKAQERLAFDAKTLEQAPLVAVSGLVELREALKLFVAEASDQVKGTETHWPDFARFDCYACHHDLAMPGWRPSRGFADAPGRPPFPTWPAALVRLGVEAANPNDAKDRLAEFDRDAQALISAFGARPFGETAKAIAAAEALSRWADDQIAGFSKLKADRATSLRLLAAIGRLAESPDLDYDSARQLAWAFRAIYGELVHRKLDPPGQADVEQALAGLDRELKLTLHASGKPEPIETELKARMQAAADFRPGAVRDLFRAASAAVARGTPAAPAPDQGQAVPGNP